MKRLFLIAIFILAFIFVFPFNLEVNTGYNIGVTLFSVPDIYPTVNPEIKRLDLYHVYFGTGFPLLPGVSVKTGSNLVFPLYKDFYVAGKDNQPPTPTKFITDFVIGLEYKIHVSNFFFAAEAYTGYSVLNFTRIAEPGYVIHAKGTVGYRIKNLSLYGSVGYEVRNYLVYVTDGRLGLSVHSVPLELGVSYKF